MFKLIATLLSGIGIFIFAIYLINASISQSITIKTQKYTHSLNTSHGSFFVGLFSSIITQSSSAINSIAVQLADKGLLKKNNKFFIVMGTNIGTTITAYLGIIGNINFANIFLLLLPISALVLLATKNEKIKAIQLITTAFCMIFAGINIISISTPSIITAIDITLFGSQNNFILLFFSTLITAICQSSSAVSLIVVMLGQAGIINIDKALFLIMGANLGTCSSALLASIGTSKEGISVAKFNFFFNLIGTITQIFFYHTGLLNFFLNISVSIDTKIALYHTFFNVNTVLLFLPFLCNLNLKKSKKLLQNNRLFKQ